MIRILLVVLFSIGALHANDKETCYTVQLVSKHSSEKNMKLLDSKNYPDNCKIMQIGKNLTVRCGCYKHIVDAKENLSILKKDYEKASVATTYKQRFSEEIDVQKSSIVETTILAPMSKVKQKSKKTCFTVQLVSRFNNKKNLNILNKTTYPQSCKLMEIGKSLTVRCGCFQEISSAKKSLKSIKKRFKKATIATTYSYRFDNKITATPKVVSTEDNIQPQDEKTTSPKERASETPVVQADEELKLMLQVFLYKGDLENAYKVASIGYNQNKTSYYWNQKMAEICQWTNRSARSMKHLRIMYEKRYDKKIEDKLIAYGSSNYQYEEIEPLVVNRARKNPTEENIDLMIKVYKEIGLPEKVVKVLDTEYRKNPKNKMLLTKALDLSLEIGDLELSKKYVNMIEQKESYTLKDAYLVAKYYYVTHDIPKAYENILQTDVKERVLSKKENKIDEIRDIKHELKLTDEDKYYQLKSDLGWYLQDNINAAISSKYLMYLGKARLVDYERIAFVYQKLDSKLARIAIKKAYKEYKLSYLFYSFANEAINSKTYDELNELIKEIDAEHSPLVNDSLFWIIKSQVYAHYKQKDLEKEALLHALKIDPDNYQTKLTLLWYFLDEKDIQKVKIILTEMAEDKNLDSSLYFPMAGAYFDINEINIASYYTQKLLHSNNRVTKLIEFKFLQAYIYQIQNNEPAFKSYMKEIVHDLKEQAKKDPELKKQDRWLSNYLRSSMYILHPDKFEKKLKKAKKYMTKKNYDEIAYSWAVKNNAYEKSLKIYNKMATKELWVRLSNNMIFQDHSKIENLLDWYLKSLSMGDKSQATEQDGQVALSQSVTFNGLQRNDDNQNAYIHHRDLSKRRSDDLKVKIAYLDRDPLVQDYINVYNRTYLQNAWYLYTGANFFINKSVDKTLLINVPNNTIEGSLGIRKIYDRGYLQANLKYYDSMRSYFGGSLEGKYRFSTDIVGKLILAKNRNAQDTTQLVLGGKKDMLSVDLTWNILNSTSIDLLHEQNRFDSQDGIYLGKGEYSRIDIQQQIRNGYPDIRIGVFYDFNHYKETSGTRGVIDRLQVKQYAILPSDFWNIGLNFSYGMQNSEAYTRVWRPYFEFTPYYTSETDDYNFGFNVGYGGKVWHQDHMSIGGSYSKSVNGLSGTVFELYLKYQFMYYHP
ncbi:MAG: tetratricopeptide repeat protein [Epsilonproteobacteria bacterium]|nr:tetratricopeptide repeat protein [Campylobacterota bacterium]